jgi:hypothetical protein
MITALLTACKCELLSQHIEKRGARIEIERVNLLIDTDVRDDGVRLFDGGARLGGGCIGRARQDRGKHGGTGDTRGADEHGAAIEFDLAASVR